MTTLAIAKTSYPQVGKPAGRTGSHLPGMSRLNLGSQEAMDAILRGQLWREWLQARGDER